MLYEYPILIYDNMPLVNDSLCLDHLIAAALSVISYLFTLKGPFFPTWCVEVYYYLSRHT